MAVPLMKPRAVRYNGAVSTPSFTRGKVYPVLNWGVAVIRVRDDWGREVFALRDRFVAVPDAGGPVDLQEADPWQT